MRKRKPKAPRKKWYLMSDGEKAAHRAAAAARNKKRLESYNPVMAARNALRREFSRSPIVIEMMNEGKRSVPQYNRDGSLSKVGAVEHLCAKCNEWRRSRKGSKVAIDHIDPVVDPKVGFVDLNTYYARMWVGRDGLQKLCGDCHQAKTNEERYVRVLTEELESIRAIEGGELSAEATKKFLKKFTPKRLAKYPYPAEFVDKITALKRKK